MGRGPVQRETLEMDRTAAVGAIVLKEATVRVGEGQRLGAR